MVIDDRARRFVRQATLVKRETLQRMYGGSFFLSAGATASGAADANTGVQSEKERAKEAGGSLLEAYIH